MVGGGIVPGWLPVAWGRGCLLIGSSDRPFPEGEEGVLEEGRKISLDHLRPTGSWDFLFQSEAPIRDNVLKLIDFGLACNFKDDRPMVTRAGPPYYRGI